MTDDPAPTLARRPPAGGAAVGEVAVMRTKELWATAREVAFESALEQGMCEQDAERYADDHAEEYAQEIAAELAEYARLTARDHDRVS